MVILSILLIYLLFSKALLFIAPYPDKHNRIVTITNNFLFLNRKKSTTNRAAPKPNHAPLPCVITKAATAKIRVNINSKINIYFLSLI